MGGRPSAPDAWPASRNTQCQAVGRPPPHVTPPPPTATTCPCGACARVTTLAIRRAHLAPPVPRETFGPQTPTPNQPCGHRRVSANALAPPGHRPRRPTPVSVPPGDPAPPRACYRPLRAVPPSCHTGAPLWPGRPTASPSCLAAHPLHVPTYAQPYVPRSDGRPLPPTPAARPGAFRPRAPTAARRTP